MIKHNNITLNNHKLHFEEMKPQFKKRNTRKHLTRLTERIRLRTVIKDKTKGNDMAASQHKNNLNNATLSEIAAELGRRFLGLLKRHQVELWSALAAAEFTYIIVKQVI